MRILHCIPSIWSGNGGPIRALIGMCNATKLAAGDARIGIATTDYGLTPDWLRSVRSRLSEDVEVHVFRQFGVETCHFSFGMLQWVWRHTAEYDVLHIHALLHPISTGCAWIARLKGKRYILRPHGNLSPYTFSHRRKRLKKLYYALLDSRVIEGAAFLHFTARLEYEAAARLGFSTPPEIIPIPYECVGKPATGPREENQVLFMGRLHPKKGLDLLLPAFARVLLACSRACLVIAGSGPKAYEESLRRKVEELGLSASVEFAGFVEGDRKEQLLRKASVFVLPSYQENFGLALVEAMSMGLPVVTTRMVDLWQEIESQGAGVAVEPEEAPLADALVTLLTDAKKREEMGKSGIRLVGAFSHEKVGGQLVHLYQKAVMR